MKMPAAVSCLLAAAVWAGGAFAEGEAMSVQVPKPAKPKVGGPCAYTDYPGTATVTRIERTEQSCQQALATGGAGYPGVEVWFKYQSPAQISPDWARKVADREQLFRLANSWYPGEMYIDKYGIKVGNTYRCVLKIIKSGTCTPAIFKFPGCRDDDYFESKKEE